MSLSYLISSFGQFYSQIFEEHPPSDSQEQHLCFDLGAEKGLGVKKQVRDFRLFRMISLIQMTITFGLLILSSTSVSIPIISEELTSGLKPWQTDVTNSGSSGLLMQDRPTSDIHLAESPSSADSVWEMELPSSNLPYGVLLGDSITERSISPEGFTTQLIQRYQEETLILNRGVGGISTRGVLPIARDLFLPNGTVSSSIRFITLLLGTNDSVGWGESRVPLGEYVQNLNTILNMLPPSVFKFLITPPVPSEVTWNGRTVQQTALYADACRQLGRELEAVGEGVVLIDFWQAMEEYLQEDGHTLEDLLEDGVHLNENGNRLLSTLILRALETHL